MHPNVDPATQKLVEAFQRELLQSAQYYQKAVAMLAADRIARDTQPVFVSPLSRRHRLRRAGITVLRWLFQHRTRKAVEAVPIDPTITVIDIDLPSNVAVSPRTATPRHFLTTQTEDEV